MAGEDFSPELLVVFAEAASDACNTTLTGKIYRGNVDVFSISEHIEALVTLGHRWT